MNINLHFVLLLRGLHEETAGPDPYEDEITKLQLRPASIPVLSFEYIRQKELREQLLTTTNYSGLVFTSQRAVTGAANCLNDCTEVQLKMFIKAWQEKSVFVVGESTRNAVKERLKLLSIGKEAGNAECLVPIICDRLEMSNLPLLFPCGNIRQETLPEKLKEKGIFVETSVVYKTRCHPELRETIKNFIALQGIPEIIVFFSPSGVNYTIPILQDMEMPLQRIKFVAIGPSTRQALLASGQHVWCTSSKPTPLDLAETIRVQLQEETK